MLNSAVSIQCFWDSYYTGTCSSSINDTVVTSVGFVYSVDGAGRRYR